MSVGTSRHHVTMSGSTLAVGKVRMGRYSWAGSAAMFRVLFQSRMLVAMMLGS